MLSATIHAKRSRFQRVTLSLSKGLGGQAPYYGRTERKHALDSFHRFDFPKLHV